MTEEQLKEIGRSIASSSHFKWMGGMKLLNGIRVLESYLTFMHHTDIPDIEDPATFGCLLKLARDKLNNPVWHPDPQDEIRHIQRVLNE